MATLNRVLHMHRAATADPHVRELRREQAVVVRVGYGEGDQVADGRWVKALELPARRRRGPAATRRCARRSASARCSAAATPCWPARSSRCARARTSTPGAGARPRCSSTPRSPSRCPSSSPGRRAATSAARLAELRDLHGGVHAAALAALQGGVEDERRCRRPARLERLEAALRARTALGFD